LTSRQRAFLQKLQELCSAQSGPVHYSVVAEEVGVNRFSAYDMLKVLEKKGMATSSYALGPGRSGPGRSMVVFEPTPRAVVVLGLDLGEEWQGVRARVLGKLREARETNPRDVLSDLVARLPEVRTPVAFCTEMIGALLLNMQRARARAGALSPFRVLAALRANGSAGLEALAGLSVGVSLNAEDEDSPSLTEHLLDHARRYQATVSKLSEEARSALVEFLEEALEALE
jgi:hypothetical protein